MFYQHLSRCNEYFLYVSNSHWGWWFMSEFRTSWPLRFISWIRGVIMHLCIRLYNFPIFNLILFTVYMMTVILILFVVAWHEGTMQPGNILHVNLRFHLGWSKWGQRCYRSFWIIYLCCGNESNIGGQSSDNSSFSLYFQNVVSGKELDSMSTMSFYIMRSKRNNWLLN